MKYILSILSICLFVNLSFGQNKDEILAEAYLLYNSEKASWNGTDIFLEQFPNKRDQIGGYLSYSNDNSHSCIFFDQEDDPNLLAKITFNENFDIQQAKIDTTSRKLNIKEKDLFEIRKIALHEMNRDTIFKKYNNTNFNIIPIITKKEKKVFVLTGPKISGLVILGNDYLLTFNKKNKLKKIKSLHKNMIPFDYDKSNKDVVTMHSHLKSTGSLITSTDICTIMLYEKYANWKQHIVVSKKNVSIWDCNKDQLLVMTRKAWENISKIQNNNN